MPDQDRCHKRRALMTCNRLCSNGKRHFEPIQRRPVAADDRSATDAGRWPRADQRHASVSPGLIGGTPALRYEGKADDRAQAADRVGEDKALVIAARSTAEKRARRRALRGEDSGLPCCKRAHQCGCHDRDNCTDRVRRNAQCYSWHPDSLSLHSLPCCLRAHQLQLVCVPTYRQATTQCRLSRLARFARARWGSRDRQSWLAPTPVSYRHGSHPSARDEGGRHPVAVSASSVGPLPPPPQWPTLSPCPARPETQGWSMTRASLRSLTPALPVG